MKYTDVKECLKKDKTTIGVMIYRKIGIVLTWMIINVFPRISANTVTASMLIFNAISGALLYYSIINNSILGLALSALVFNFSIALDCVDGNIARINKKSSIYGVFLDRLVHNITYPGLFWIIGFAIFNNNSITIILLLFILTGVFEEVSPIEVAIKDVKEQFLDQMINNNTQVFDINKHSVGIEVSQKKNIDKSKNVNKKKNIIKVILDAIPLWNRLFILTLLDILILKDKYYFLIAYSLIFLCYKIISQSRKVKGNLDITYKILSKL